MRDSCERLESLLKSAQPLILCETVEEDRLRTQLRMAAYSLNLPFFEWSIVSGLLKNGQVSQPNTSEPIECLHFINTFRDPAVFLLKDFNPHLQTPTLIRLFREVAMRLANSLSSMVLSSPEISLPGELAHLAVPFELKLPDRAELRTLVGSVLDGLSKTQKIRVEINSTDFESLLTTLSGLTLRQARQVVTYAILFDNALTAKDIDLILQRKTQLIQDAGVLDFYPPSTQNVEVGGFSHLKQWLTTARTAFSPEAQKLNIPAPKGLLLVGVPGCGKSLCVKMIASQWKQPLVRLDASRLFDKYVGATERNFKKATEIAEAMSPCVFWIDEIEKMIGSGQDSDSDGGVSQRLLGSFLTWMQEKNHQVFLAATANDLSKLPPELLRKGRFDEIFFVDLPTLSERVEILSLHLKAHTLDPHSFDLNALAQALEGFSGAEIAQWIVTTLLKCVSDNEQISTEKLRGELKFFVPLSRSRGEEIERLRTMAKTRFRPVG